MGVKIGDLNASASAHAGMILPRSHATVSFEALDRVVTAGETFEVEINLAEAGSKISGGQWELLFDGASLVNVQPVANGLTEEMWNITDSGIRFAWTPKEAVKTTGIIKLSMIAAQAGKISEMIHVDHSFMSSELYDEYEQVYSLDLNWRTETIATEVEEIQLHQNRPNPWDTETVIPFEIAEAGEVTLSITNSLGVEMSSTTQQFAAGKQQFKITNHSWANGLYYYTIRSGDTQLTKTMLILNKH